MGKMMKRLTAMLLLVCTLASFIVPATYADADTEVITYDFQLYQNSLFSSVCDGAGNKYRTNLKTAVVNAFKEGTNNWKVETWESTVVEDDVRFFKKNNEGLRLNNFEGKWIAFRVNVAKAGNYEVSFKSSDAKTYPYTATVYALAAPDTTMKAAQIEEVITSKNLVGSASLSTKPAEAVAGAHTFAAGDNILIVCMDGRGSFTDIVLTATEEPVVPTTEAGTTAPATEGDTTAPALEPIHYDFKLHKDEHFAAILAAQYKYRNETADAIENAYADGSHNWMVEQWQDSMTFNNVTFPEKNTEEGMRITSAAGKWVAFRMRVNQTGTFQVAITSNHTVNTYDYNATAWVIPAPAETMSRAELEAAMVDANKLGTAEIIKSGVSGTLGEYDFAEGEYILILSPDNDSRASIANIDLIPVEETEEPTDSTTDTTVEATTADTTASEPTEDTIVSEPTEDTTVPVPQPVHYDFQPYNNSLFSSVCDGAGNKYRTGLKNAIVNAYKNGTHNWKVEAWEDTIIEDNVRFFSKYDEGLRLSNFYGKWIALRIDVPQAGEYKVSFTSNNADSYDYQAAVFAMPAPEETMSTTEIEGAMVVANYIGTLDMKENKQTAAGIHTFAAGDNILILGFAADRASFVSIDLTPATESDDSTESTTDPTIIPDPTTDTTPPATMQDNFFDFELFNYAAFSGVIDGNYNKYWRDVKKAVDNAYPTKNNWKVETWTEAVTNESFVFVKADPSLRFTLGIDNWVAIRLNVTQAGKYDVIFNGKQKYSADAWLIPATADAMTAEEAAAAMVDANKLGTIAMDSKIGFYNVATYDFAQGEYILILKANTERIHLQNIQLAAVGEVEKPAEDTRTEYENKPGYFDMRLFNYKGFDAVDGEYVKYNKTASMMKSKYPTSVNWILEAVSANVTTKDDVQFIVAKGEGLRMTADEGVNGEWIALRLNNTRAGNYDLVINSDVGIYSGKVYLFPATAETMTTQQIAALMTEENRIGNIKFTSDQDRYNLGEYEFKACEYIIVLQADKDRVTVDSIEIIDHYVEVPKEPVDKVLYDFDLVKLDPQFADKGFTNWYNSETKKVKVEQVIAQMYANDVIQWKYETMSSTASRFNCRKNHTQVKASTNFKEIENAWNAVRIEAPGAGTYDVRLNSDVKSGVVADVYLIPAKTGIEMTKAEIEAGMTAQNCLVSGAVFNVAGDTYLGEYTFGTEYEYVMVFKFSYGKKMYITNIQMTKDGLVADSEVKKLPTYNGVVYNFDIGDEFTGMLQPLGEYRYDAPTPKEDGYASPYEQANAAWKNGSLNWKWIAASDDLVEYDANMNPYPNDYIRFYQNTGMYIYSRPNSWVAFKIKSPGSGDFTLTMNHAVSANDGTVAVYVLPADTPTDQIWQATDPSNRVGKVVLTKPDGTSGKKDGFESFVGYWNFEAGKEYILVLEAYAASQFSASMSNMNITNIVMQKGIHEYEVEKDKTVKPITVKERVLATSDLGNGNVAVFEMNGMDYYLTHLEGGTLLLYNLTTGELEKESFASASRPRQMAVAPDGKIWITGCGKYLVCYDPQENTVEKTKTFMPKEYKHNGPAYLTITPEGVIYFGLNLRGNIVKYDPATKAFTDLGYFVGPDDDVSGLFYLDGYLYSQHRVADTYNKFIKYNTVTGKIEGEIDFSDVNDSDCTHLSLLGDDVIVVGGKTFDNDHTMAFNKDTMEFVDLGLPGSVSKTVTEVIDGKQYMVLSSYGLYAYDVETKEITKVPGFNEMTGTGFRTGAQHSFGKSFATINGDICLISNDSQVTSCPRVVNLTKKEYYRWTDLTREANGGGSRIISFTETEPGAGELVMGHWNAEFISTYNIYTGEVTAVDSAGQTDSIGYYKGILYGGCYSATVLVELHRETEEIIQRFKLDHDLTGQKRLLSMETGGDHVFVGSIPGSFINGGALTVYNTITGQWHMERNLVQDQSIVDMAYCQDLVFAASSRKGGDNSQYAGDSAVIVAYDYLNREKLAVLDPRDYISGLASPVHYIYGLTADPNAEENGRVWAIVSDTLFCFTFDKETKTFNVQEVYSLGKSVYTTTSGVDRTQRKIEFIPEKNQMYLTLWNSGVYMMTMDNWDAPIGQVKINSAEKLMGYKPEDYIIAEDGNMYFGNDADLKMMPLNVTDEDWAIAENMDAQIKALYDTEITIESLSAVRTTRSDYENMAWRYKALVQNLEILQEAESDILECLIDDAILKAGEIDADDYPVMLELNEEYKDLNARQQRYVKNYAQLKEAYETSSDLNDQRAAAAMQKKINALKDIMPIETLEKQPQVDAVRAEFAALPGRQRILCDTKILEEAEAQIAALRAELVKEVEALIQAIPAEITLAAEPAITAAREGVDKLTALERKQVSYSKLEASEAKLRNLKNAVTKAAEVDAMIKAIGIVTLGDKARIAQARQAYNALNETARAFVTKYGKLKRAEFILSGLQTWMIPAFVVVGAGAAFCVVWFVPSLHSKVFKTKKKETEEIEQ